LQKILVAREEVMFPKMVAKPGATRHPNAMIGGIDRRRAAPNIGIMVQDPPTCGVMRLGSFAARLDTIFDQPKQWFVALGKIAHFGRPIIHLGVDVNRPFAVPRGLELIIPYSLQVCRLSPRTAAGY